MAIDASVSRPDLVHVFTKQCRTGRSDCGCKRGGNPQHLALTSRGAFSLHVGRRVHVAAPFRGIWSPDNLEYSVSHPCAEGHEYTIITADPAVWDELRHRRSQHNEREVRYGWQGHAAHLRLKAAAEQHNLDRLAVEEMTLELMQTLVSADERVASSERHRSAVDRTRAAIYAQLDENIGVRELSQLARCSPFHLARIFRAETGQSMRSYRRSARIANALTLISQGNDSLVRIAMDCGFSTQSHMTECFRTVLGKSPSSVRISARERL